MSIEPEQEKQKAPKEILDINELKEVFRGMVASCEEYSPDAVEIFLEKLKNSFSSRQTASIEYQVEHFDFDRAREETIRLAGELGIELEENI